MPERWSAVPLQELLLSMESGSRPRGGVRGIAEGVPSLGGEHLNADGGFNLESIRYVPREFYRHMRRGHIGVGDILIVKDGATTGKVALVRGDFPFAEAVGNEHIFVCRPRAVSSEYLFWFLYSAHGQERILRHFKGSAQGGITQEFAAGTLVPVAPPAVQDEIARVLNAMASCRGSARTNLNRTLRAVSRFRQAVLAAAVSGSLTVDWRARALQVIPVPEILARHRSSTHREGRGRPRTEAPDTAELPSLPSTWAWATLGEVADVRLGGTPSRKVSSYWGGGVPWVSSGEVANSRIATTRETISSLGLAQSNAKLYPAGTVLIAMIGEGKTRGQASILDIEAATNQNVAGVLVDRSILMPEYVWRWALAQYEVTRAVGRGGNQPALNAQKVRELIVPIPPPEEQTEITRRVDRLLTLTHRLQERIEQVNGDVDRSFQAALAKAFRSELAIGD